MHSALGKTWHVPRRRLSAYRAPPKDTRHSTDRRPDRRRIPSNGAVRSMIDASGRRVNIRRTRCRGCWPGAGGGVFAENAGVNFIESSVDAPNGPIAANGGTTFVQAGSPIVLARGMGILLFEPLSAVIKDTHVHLTQPLPSGCPKVGDFAAALQRLRAQIAEAPCANAQDIPDAIALIDSAARAGRHGRTGAVLTEGSL